MVSIDLESFEMTLNGEQVTFFVKKGTEGEVAQRLSNIGERLTIAERRPVITQSKDSGKVVTRVKWANREYDCTPVPPPKEVPMPDAETADSATSEATEAVAVPDDATKGSETAENDATVPPSEGAKSG